MNIEKPKPGSFEHRIKSLVIDYSSPEYLAEAFASLDSKQQAQFYNRLAEIATNVATPDGYWFPFQLQYITDEDGLTLAGRRVMQMIGEYSHWGLVPK